MPATTNSEPSTASFKVKPVSFIFPDDGLVPNNPLPFLIYKGAVIIDNGDPEQTMEEMFHANGWGQSWRNGIFDYLHYHATVHEVLGVARGRALVRFGGDHGEDFEIRKGDVAILPAGTGHQCLSASDDFAVVGAYPPGQQMQVTRPTPENYRLAVRMIPQVALPETDPVYGQQGPLVELWRKRRR
ncbi:MAG: cupin domain-containing protein [Afipia sp.]|nr:cupin domain-containing protein [Afipia sp.]